MMLVAESTWRSLGMDGAFVGRAAELAELELLTTGPGPHAAVVVGPAGVGKTRLAREWMNSAERVGLAILWIPATQSVSELPFGALASFLPTTGQDSEAPADSWPELLRRLGETLVQHVSGRRLAFVVDDAHLLDEASAALVRQLVAMGEAVGVLTVRSGEAVPTDIVALWKDGMARRIELSGLHAGAVEELARGILGGPADPAFIAELIRRCGGNTLYICELIRGRSRTGVCGRATDCGRGYVRWPRPPG